jgi:hypothetical protein
MTSDILTSESTDAKSLLGTWGHCEVCAFFSFFLLLSVHAEKVEDIYTYSTLPNGNSKETHFHPLFNYSA